MDDRSASRLAAYKHGRGAEYDDTMAAREEVRKKYGVAAKPSPHGHGHSLLADPAVIARRAADITRADGRWQSGQARRRFETRAATSASNVSSQTRQCHS